MRAGRPEGEADLLAACIVPEPVALGPALRFQQLGRLLLIVGILGQRVEVLLAHVRPGFRFRHAHERIVGCRRIGVGGKRDLFAVKDVLECPSHAGRQKLALEVEGDADGTGIVHLQVDEIGIGGKHTLERILLDKAVIIVDIAVRDERIRLVEVVGGIQAHFLEADVVCIPIVFVLDEKDLRRREGVQLEGAGRHIPARAVVVEGIARDVEFGERVARREAVEGTPEVGVLVDLALHDDLIDGIDVGGKDVVLDGTRLVLREQQFLDGVGGLL